MLKIYSKEFARNLWYIEISLQCFSNFCSTVYKRFTYLNSLVIKKELLETIHHVNKGKIFLHLVLFADTNTVSPILTFPSFSDARWTPKRGALPCLVSPLSLVLWMWSFEDETSANKLAFDIHLLYKTVLCFKLWKLKQKSAVFEMDYQKQFCMIYLWLVQAI